MATFALTLLGGFRVSRTGQTVEIPAKKAKALLAYLALQAGQEFQRDRLATLLWEDSSDAQARQSLRQALSELRKVLPASSLEATTESVCLRSDDIDVDVDQFQELAASDETAARERAIELYRGEFLEGFNPRSAPFEDWLMVERSHLRESVTSLMRDLLTHYEAQRKQERAIQLALRLLATDPLQEPVHRKLMQLYAQQGRFTESFKQFRACQGVLQRELGVAPDAQTEQLYHELQAARRQPVRAPKTAASAPSEAQQTEANTEPVPQLRQVTVCHIRWVPPEAPLESLPAQREHFYERVHACLKNYGGMVVQKLSDAVVGSFGLPKAHTNDPERALRATLELRADETTGFAMGIASGQVLASGEDLVTGDALTLARDLAHDAARGEVLITDEVYQAVRRSVKVTGGDEWYKVEGWQTHGESSEPFIGRRIECAQFTAALELCLEAGHGQAFLVRGDAGIGKTRLLQEYARLATDRGFECHHTLILDFGTGGDDPVQSLLRGMCRPGSERWLKLMQEYSEDTHERLFIFDLVNEPLPAPQQAIYDAMESSVRQTGRARLMRRMLEHVCTDAAILLLVEDIHWATRNALESLAQIAASVDDCQSMLVMTSRVEGEALDPEWRGAMQGTALTTIDLGPLRDEEALRFARQFEIGDEDFVRRCIERAGGNPLFLEQLLRVAQEGGGADTVPDSVQALVWARLDGLATNDRRALQAASIMGQRFELDALRYLLDRADYECAELIRQRLVRREGSGFLFSHALVMEGVYTSMLQSQREALHLRAAEWFRDRDLASCAEQLDRAQQATDAAATYLQAARDRSRHFQYERAVALANRGLELSSDIDERLELLCLRGEAHLGNAEPQQSLQSFRHAQELAIDNVSRVRAALGQVSVYRLQDQHDEALRVLQTAEALAKQQQDDALLAQIYLLRGNALFPLGRVAECLEAQQSACEHAERADSSALQARALGGLADAYYQRGHMLTAERYFDQCVALCREHGFTQFEPGNLAMRGLARFYQCRVDDALADTNQAAALAVQIGSKRDEIVALNIIGLVELLCGDYRAALASSEYALVLAQQLGARRFEAELVAQCALIHAELGNNDGAEILISRAEGLAEQVSPQYLLAWVLAIKAFVGGDDGQKQRLLDEGEAQLERGAVSHNYLHFCEIAIDVSLALNDHERIGRYADMLEQYTHTEELPWAQRMVRRARALAQNRKQKTEASETRLQEVHQELTSCGLDRAVRAVVAALGISN